MFLAADPAFFLAAGGFLSLRLVAPGLGDVCVAHVDRRHAPRFEFVPGVRGEPPKFANPSCRNSPARPFYNLGRQIDENSRDIVSEEYFGLFDFAPECFDIARPGPLQPSIANPIRPRRQRGLNNGDDKSCGYVPVIFEAALDAAYFE